jgi:hypothetical protein
MSSKNSRVPKKSVLIRVYILVIPGCGRLRSSLFPIVITTCTAAENMQDAQAANQFAGFSAFIYLFFCSHVPFSYAQRLLLDTILCLDEHM